MKSKLPIASFIAIAATLTTALIGPQGAGAAAQDIAPAAETVVPVVTATTETQFVSQPVIQQALEELETASKDAPAEPETKPVSPKGDADASGSSAAISASSLNRLVSAQPQPRQLSRELQCLAGAVYFESRGESLPGQLAVGRVIVARAKSGRFPGSYCGVVYQPSQFSFVSGSRMPAIATGTGAWRNAVAIAQIAHAGTWRSPAEGALFFHAARINPAWRLTRIARVDNHVFYR